MAVTITDIELAAALRLGDGTTALEAPTAAIVGRLLGVGTAIVGEYVPELDNSHVENEAVVRIAAFLYDNNPARNRRFADVLANSGAISILQPFRVQRAVALEGDEAAAIPTRGGLNQAQVNALIVAALAGYARNADLYTDGEADARANARIAALVDEWALQANASIVIPDGKLGVHNRHVAGSAGVSHVIVGVGQSSQTNATVGIGDAGIAHVARGATAIAIGTFKIERHDTSVGPARASVRLLAGNGDILGQAVVQLPTASVTVTHRLKVLMGAHTEVRGVVVGEDGITAIEEIDITTAVVYEVPERETMQQTDPAEFETLGHQRAYLGPLNFSGAAFTHLTATEFQITNERTTHIRVSAGFSADATGSAIVYTQKDVGEGGATSHALIGENVADSTLAPGQTKTWDVTPVQWDTDESPRTLKIAFVSTTQGNFTATLDLRQQALGDGNVPVAHNRILRNTTLDIPAATFNLDGTQISGLQTEYVTLNFDGINLDRLDHLAIYYGIDHANANADIDERLIITAGDILHVRGLAATVRPNTFAEQDRVPCILLYGYASPTSDARPPLYRPDGFRLKEYLNSSDSSLLVFPQVDAARTRVNGLVFLARTVQYHIRAVHARYEDG